jgi:hypothetical protein
MKTENDVIKVMDNIEKCMPLQDGLQIAMWEQRWRCLRENLEMGIMPATPAEVCECYECEHNWKHISGLPITGWCYMFKERDDIDIKNCSQFKRFTAVKAEADKPEVERSCKTCNHSESDGDLCALVRIQNQRKKDYLPMMDALRDCIGADHKYWQPRQCVKSCRTCGNPLHQSGWCEEGDNCVKWSSWQPKQVEKVEGETVTEQHGRIIKELRQRLTALETKVKELEKYEKLMPLLEAIAALITLNTITINSMPEISQKRKDEMWTLKDKCWDMITKLVVK